MKRNMKLNYLKIKYIRSLYAILNNTFEFNNVENSSRKVVVDWVYWDEECKYKDFCLFLRDMTKNLACCIPVDLPFDFDWKDLDDILCALSKKLTVYAKTGEEFEFILPKENEDG